MKRYTIFQAPLMAFFSTGFYRDVGLNWKGTGFASLFLLLVMCWIPLSIRIHFSIADLAETKAPGIASQIPTITIIEGKAAVDVAQPYKIINPGNGKLLALIDTTGRTVSLEGTEARALLTRTGVMYRKNDGKITGFNFKPVKRYVLDRQEVSKWLRLFRHYGAAGFFLIAFVGSFAFRIVQVLAYAAIGLIFAKWCKTSQSYQTCLRLSVMAVFPVIIVNTVAEIIGVTIPLERVLYFMATMGYLFMGVKAVSMKKSSLTEG